MQRQASHNLTARQAAIAMPTATRLKQPTCNVEPTYCTRFVRGILAACLYHLTLLSDIGRLTHILRRRERERESREERPENPLNIAHQTKSSGLPRRRAHNTLMNSGGSQRRVKQKREEAGAIAASPASSHAAGIVPACRRCWEELSAQEHQMVVMLGFEQWSWDTRAGAGAGVPAPACSALVPPSASAAPNPTPPPRKRRAAAAAEEAEDASKPTAPPPPPPRRGRAVAAVGAALAAAHTPGKAAASVVARAAAAAAPAAASASMPAVGHPLRTSLAFKRPSSRTRGAAHLTSETI